MKRWIILLTMGLWAVDYNTITHRYVCFKPFGQQVSMRGEVLYGDEQYCLDQAEALNAAHERRTQPLGIRVRPNPKQWCDEATGCRWDGHGCICINDASCGADDCGKDPK